MIDLLRTRLVRAIAQRLDEPGFALAPHDQTLLARMGITSAIQAGLTKQVQFG